MSPVLYKIRNPLSGDTKVVHVENLQPAHPEKSWDKNRTECDHFEAIRPKHKKVKRTAPTRIQPLTVAKLVTSAPHEWLYSDADHSSSDNDQEEMQNPDLRVEIQSYDIHCRCRD